MLCSIGQFLYGITQAAHNIGRTLLEDGNLALKFRGQPEVVRIQERNDFPTRRPDPVVPSRRWSGVLLIDNTNSITILFESFLSVVGGSVIDNDDFRVTVSLVEDAVNRVPHNMAPVVAGDNRAHEDVVIHRIRFYSYSCGVLWIDASS